MVSPRARPRPSIEAEMTPGRPKGSTAVRMISQRVAPSASAASMCAVGVWAKTSRLRAVTIGRIMIARMTEPAKIEFRRSTVSLRLNSGIQPSTFSMPVWIAVQVREHDVRAPEAVDDGGHRGEQVDRWRRTAAPAVRGAYWVMNSATPTETGTEITIAITDEITVTHSRSGMPNCGGLSPGFQTRAVRKFAVVRGQRRDRPGQQEHATAAMRATTSAPDPTDRPAKMRSPRRLVRRRRRRRTVRRRVRSGR